MKHILFPVGCWFICLAFSFSNDTSPIERILCNKIPWQLKTSENELSIHYRWLKNNCNQKTRQLKCSTSAIISPQLIKSVLQNQQYSKQWLSKVEQCTITPGENPNEWYTYLLFDFPWPMAKRDIVIHNKFVKQGDEIVIQMLSVKENKSKEKVTRMKGFYGYWKYSTETHQLEYSIYSNVKSKVPTWATDPFIEQNLIKCIGRFKNLLIEQTH